MSIALSFKFSLQFTKSMRNIRSLPIQIPLPLDKIFQLSYQVENAKD